LVSSNTLRLEEWWSISLFWNKFINNIKKEKIQWRKQSLINQLLRSIILNMSRDKILYFLRWQFSTLVLTPIMLGLELLGFSTIPNLIIAQTIGAFIFYFIDKRIFTKRT
jgi:ABC-type multidrug transport system permease subunit